MVSDRITAEIGGARWSHAFHVSTGRVGSLANVQTDENLENVAAKSKEIWRRFY